MTRGGAFCCRCERAEATFRPANLPLREEPMKSYSGYTKCVGKLHLAGRLWLRSLPAMAMALLLMLPIDTSAKAAVPAAGGNGHPVYLLRGVVTIFFPCVVEIAGQ